jgi:thioredoxin reductase (NADPH)
MEERSSTDTGSGATIYDLIIIGGGPAGLSAAIYGGRGGLKTLVLDKNPTAGALGLTDKVANYPGLLGVWKGEDILGIFREQAKGFGVEFLQLQVMGVDFRSEIKVVMGPDRMFRARAVIIATGAMGRTPTIEGEEKLTGKGVSYCATCDAPFFRGKAVALTGTLDEMLEELDTVCRFAAKVYIITHNRELSPRQEEMMKAQASVEVFPGSRVTRIQGEKHVEAIVVKGAGAPELRLEVEGVFVYLHGNKPIVDFLYGAVEISPVSCIVVDKATMTTSVPGIFAAGDVSCKELRQVVLAAAEGCTAALSAEKYLTKRTRSRLQWS